MSVWTNTLSLSFLLIVCLIIGCKKSEAPLNPLVNGAFMSMEATEQPKLLAPSILASSLDEYNGTFSPDGTEFYFTTNTPINGIITYSTMNNDSIWGIPKVAPFSGEYSEYDPLFSPDGKRLYFSSERPVAGVESSGATHIWYVEREGSGWSEARYLDLQEGGNYYSSITSTGDICFNRWRDGDMYIAKKRQDGYDIKALPAPVNSNGDEGDPFISPDGDYIIFRAYNDGLGQGDLFITYKIGTHWSAPENLETPINSSAHELCPYVTTDGKFLIFASGRMESDYEAASNTSIVNVRDKHNSADNGELNIYYISADFIAERREKHLIEDSSIDK